ncbi:MAG: RHS repeat-associated core domain-containing protein, partial [Chloroflexota bacterium]
VHSSAPAVKVRKTYMLAGQPIAQRSYVRPSAADTSDTAARQDEALHFIYTDHLGSANTLVNHNTENGINEVIDTRYLPFGGIRSGGEQLGDATERGFTGHHENRSIGLTYMNARYYVPGIGRFLSADTIVPDPLNPQQFNRYSYVLNNPIIMSDPSGHSGQIVFDGGATPNPWGKAKSEYKEGDDIHFGPVGGIAPKEYAYINLPFSSIGTEGFAVEVMEISGYFIGGAGVAIPQTPGDPGFPFSSEAPIELETGVGLEGTILGLKMGAKRVNILSGNSAATEWEAGALIGIGDGVSFDANAIVIRPDANLASALATGDDEVWASLWEALYAENTVELPEGVQGPIEYQESIIPQEYVYLGRTLLPMRPHRQYGDFIPVIEIISN